MKLKQNLARLICLSLKSMKLLLQTRLEQLQVDCLMRLSVIRECKKAFNALFHGVFICEEYRLSM